MNQGDEILWVTPVMLNEGKTREEEEFRKEDNEPYLGYAGFRLEMSHLYVRTIDAPVFCQVVREGLEILLGIAHGQLTEGNFGAISDLAIKEPGCRPGKDLYWEQRWRILGIFESGRPGQRGGERTLCGLEKVMHELQNVRIVNGALSIETQGHEELYAECDHGRLIVEANARCPKYHRLTVPNRKIETTKVNPVKAIQYRTGGEMLNRFVKKKGHFWRVNLYLRHPDYYSRYIPAK